MADILLDLQSAPTTPASGQGIFWFDTNGLIPCFKNANGDLYARSENAATAAQSTFASDTYVTGSNLIIPSFTISTKSYFMWEFSASKTAAGVATPIYSIRIGSAGTTADTARLTLTGPAQTAIADIGTLRIMLTARAGGAACILQGTAWWDHRGTAVSSTIGTGFANDGTGHVEGTGASFDASGTAGQFIGISINGGASAAWTMTQCIAQAKW